jgi:hypothetical protein
VPDNIVAAAVVVISLDESMGVEDAPLAGEREGHLNPCRTLMGLE